MNTNTEIIRYQLKTEIDLVRMQEQIGSLLRHIPIIEMDDILEEVFAIDVDDVENHTYDERFATLFGLNQMTVDEVKQEPVFESSQQIDETPNGNSCPHIAITETNIPANNTTQRSNLDTIPTGTAMAAGNSIELLSNGPDLTWLIDITDENCEMGGFIYEDRFAKYFAPTQNISCIKQESNENRQVAQLAGNPSEKEQYDFSRRNCKQELKESSHMIQPSGSALQEDVQTTSPERDPLSHDYHFEIDVCVIEMNTYYFHSH